MTSGRVVVIGAGAAGLTAAHALTERGVAPIVLERRPRVGGLARTESYAGYRFDLGGHRFFTRIGAIERLWERMLGADFLHVARLSRIHYRGRFFDYPLSPVNALVNLGAVESLAVLASYMGARVRPIRPERSFEDWVVNRFGRRLFEVFFKGYTEKVWGIPCREIGAEWAAQRIRGLSLRTALANALFGTGRESTLIREFRYPVLGPGMMWERFAEAVVAGGGEVRLGREVSRLTRDGDRLVSLTVEGPDGRDTVGVDHVISTMPLPRLVQRIDPPPPAPVLAAASALRHRALIVVALVVDRVEAFPDTWIYVHGGHVRVGRIQNFRNWSPALVPDPATTCLGLEYFCTEGDEQWRQPDAVLVALAVRELDTLGLVRPREVRDGVVVREPEAYPVYAGGHVEAVASIRGFVERLGNLQTIGRNGLHRYNNQDHSMLTGLMAADNLFGARRDPWIVNTEAEHLESGGPAAGREAAAQGRGSTAG